MPADVAPVRASAPLLAPRRLPLRRWGAYLAMIAATVGCFLAILEFGRRLTAPAAAVTARTAIAASAGTPHLLAHVLAAMAGTMLAGRLLGALLRPLRQPPVVGEVIAGIVLGPSLLGRISPGLSGLLLPTSVAPGLGLVAQVGIILYMFVVGLKLDVSVLRRRSHAAVVVSHASIIVPFILGALLALLLYPRLSNQRVDFLHFALFGGVAMSVTAFPVLSRILTDIRADSTRLGAIALSCAAVDDVTAWCLLAFVVSMVNGRAAGGLLTVVLALAYLGVMLVAVRPLLVRLTRPLPRWIEKQVPGLVLLMLLLSATATELIGIHAVFGAFALGAVIPRESRTARDLTRSLEDLVVTLFLPAFFICTGLRTQLGLLAGAEQWLLAGLILLVACLGKFGGTLVAARGVGLGWRDAAGLGILMNTRGLMELIVLNLGVDLGVISPPLFAMLVLMAIVTTAATSPLLHVMKVFERAGSPD